MEVNSPCEPLQAQKDINDGKCSYGHEYVSQIFYGHDADSDNEHAHVDVRSPSGLLEHQQATAELAAIP